MTSLGAIFMQVADARRAARRLTTGLGLPGTDIAIGTLGDAGSRNDGRPLLAVRVPDESLGHARLIITTAGGQIVAEIRPPARFRQAGPWAVDAAAAG